MTEAHVASVLQQPQIRYGTDPSTPTPDPSELHRQLTALAPGETLERDDGWTLGRLEGGCWWVSAPPKKVLGWHLCPKCGNKNAITEGLAPDHCSRCALRRVLGGWTINGYYFPKEGEGDNPHGNSSGQPGADL